MMRDRASSDPAMLVTGGGEFHLTSSDENEELESETGSGDIDSNSSQVDELMGDDGPDGLNLITQASLRAEIKRLNTLLDKDGQEQEDTFSDMDDEDDADLDDNTATPRARSAKRRPLSSAEKSAPVVGHDRLPTLDHLAGRTDEDPMSTGARTATRNASPGPSTRPDEGKTPARSSSPNKRSATTSSHTTRAAGKGKAAESAIEEMNRILRENKQQSIIEKQQTKRMKYELKLKNQEKGTKVDLIERQMSNLQVRIESIHLMTSNNTSMLASINAHLGVISRQGDGIIPSTPFRASASPVHQWASSSSSSSSSHAPTFSHPTTSAQGTTSFYPMASSYQPTESNYSNDDV